MRDATTGMPTPQKPYYVILDGLRGVAAIVILVFHYFEMIYPNYADSPLGHGFLAVDFFFCLSGFVIGYAYDDRIGRIGIKNFFGNRLIRLHPLVILGTVIGLIGFLADPFVVDTLAAGWWPIIGATLGSLLLIPMPILPFRAGALFPFNSPSWSLFFEYIANIVYALVLSRIKRSWLLVLGILSALWLTYTASQAGWIINGWDAATYTDGFPRVTFSFIAGLLVFRYRAIWKNRFGLLLPLLLLMGVFMFPHHENDWITESVLVIVAFPLILSIGAGAVANGFIERICIFIGRLSYPLYMTHITTVWIFGNYYYQYKPTGMKLAATISGLLIANVLLAYIVMRVYDEPVRAWLTRSRKKKRD